MLKGKSNIFKIISIILSYPFYYHFLLILFWQLKIYQFIQPIPAYRS